MAQFGLGKASMKPDEYQWFDTCEEMASFAKEHRPSWDWIGYCYHQSELICNFVFSPVWGCQAVGMLHQNEDGTYTNMIAKYQLDAVIYGVPA